MRVLFIMLSAKDKCVVNHSRNGDGGLLRLPQQVDFKICKSFDCLLSKRTGFMRRIAIMALGMYLLSILHGCTGETKKSSGANHSEQKEVTEVFSGNFETREIHVDKNGMDIYGVVHIPTGIEEKMPDRKSVV